MNIVRITAGLGNQMFQYAFYRALKQNKPDTKMDISEFGYRKHHYGYELEKVFNIIPDYSSKNERNALADISKDFFSEIRRKILKIKLNSKGTVITESSVGHAFHADLLHSEQSYFIGFWQSEKYFADISDMLRKELTFKEIANKENQRLIDKIESTNSVSLHIRRGDYVKKRRIDTVGSVCSTAYYQRAVDYIRSKTDQPLFFVFSDDIVWVKENLKIEDAIYVDINRGEASYRDMRLMSLCRHNIIANSSFSWWGAWLNQHPGKIVIAPSVWFRDVNMPDIVPESWVRISVE